MVDERSVLRSDGEAVSFTLLIDDSAVGEVSVSGNTWATPPIDFSV